MHAEDHDRHLRRGGRQLAGGFDAVEIGHADVHHQHVGRELLRHRNGFAAVRCLADHLEIGLTFEHQTQAGAHHGVIVSQHDSRHGIIGTRCGQFARRREGQVHRYSGSFTRVRIDMKTAV